MCKRLTQTLLLSVMLLSLQSSPVSGIQQTKPYWVAWEAPVPLSAPRIITITGGWLRYAGELPENAPTYGVINLDAYSACWTVRLDSGAFHRVWRATEECYTTYFPVFWTPEEDLK